MSLTEDAAKVSGIPYVMDAYRSEAELVLNGESDVSPERGFDRQRFSVSARR